MINTLIHHIRHAAKAAGVRWSADCDAELQAEQEALEARFEQLEAQVRALQERLDTPDWRDRR